MCDILTEKKYLTRPSPPRPANSYYCRGKTYVGNDGNFWTSVINDKNGVYRWVKVKDEKNASPKGRKASPKGRKASPKGRKASPKGRKATAIPKGTYKFIKCDYKTKKCIPIF